MGEGELRLVEPAEEFQQAYLDYIDEFRKLEPGRIPAKLRDQLANDFGVYLKRCRDDAAGRNIDPARVPQTCYWLFRGDRMLGACRLRHRLNDSLVQHGGHIGYDVRPTERRKGYATAMLGMVLERARALGLTRVMVTCDKDNIASARVIRKNGGVLDREAWWEENGTRIRIQIHWIDLLAAVKGRGAGPLPGSGRFEAVIFDVCGALADNWPMADFDNMLRKAAGRLGVQPEAFLRAANDETAVREADFGTPGSIAAIIERYSRQIGCTPPAEAVEAAADLWQDFARLAIAPRPDAPATLAELRRRGLKVGVISDCAADLPAVWAASPLAGLVDQALFSCVEKIAKPDPRIYARACERLGVRPDCCLYVGDGGSDELAGACRAGMAAALICAPYEEEVVMARPAARLWEGPRIAFVGEVLGLLCGRTCIER